MRKLILFGMPGTGKSTAAKYISEDYIELDLSSDMLSDKQLSKIRSFTKQLVSLDFDVLSSYPLYFSESVLRTEPTKDCRMIVAIPHTQVSQRVVLDRIAKRGGEYVEFLETYKQNGKLGIDDGSRKFKDNPYVETILYYDNEVNAALKKGLKTGELVPLSKVTSVQRGK